MAKTEKEYVIEREYLSKISPEELLRKIIRAYLNQERPKEKEE